MPAPNGKVLPSSDPSISTPDYIIVHDILRTGANVTSRPQSHFWVTPRPHTCFTKVRRNTGKVWTSWLRCPTSQHTSLCSASSPRNRLDELPVPAKMEKAARTIRGWVNRNQAEVVAKNADLQFGTPTRTHRRVASSISCSLL